MNRTPAHDRFVASAQGKLRASLAPPVISYIGADSGYVLQGFSTDFRRSSQATEQTLSLMKGLVWQSIGKPIIHRASSIIRASAIANNELLHVALFRYVKTNVSYVPDEVLIEQGMYGRELLIAPDVLLAMNPAEGDCDDFAMVAASLAISLGMRAKFIAVALERDNPNRFSHVFMAVEDTIGANGKKDWISLDCSHGTFAGWEVSGQLKRVELTV